MALKPEDEAIRQQLLKLVREIPEGRVQSYGGLGACCDPPISGYIAGRYLGRGTEAVPWWRVVAKSGLLPIVKRNPDAAKEQREYLEAEGVEFGADGKVLEKYYLPQTKKA